MNIQGYLFDFVLFPDGASGECQPDPRSLTHHSQSASQKHQPNKHPPSRYHPHPPLPSSKIITQKNRPTIIPNPPTPRFQCFGLSSATLHSEVSSKVKLLPCAPCAGNCPTSISSQCSSPSEPKIQLISKSFKKQRGDPC